ncbi:lysine-specific histone demethylase 1 homolog 3 [Argentina anserina]|uniref:lysine-specific histone demethylase 1 homolog 3 n=1 Tax=Argentina anserina TaxID=57926 RepID=UPI0021763285|nr:lysine-specific histone demethylase 1 homolog 3 [Potentilla anserina]
MDGDEKRLRARKRSKLMMVNLNLDGDDEPIGTLLKKRLRNPKKVKLGLVGERGKKVEVGEGDFGGLDDTLASLRKKLKGPKKDSGARGRRSSSLDVVQSSDQDGGSDGKSVSRSIEKGVVRGDDDGCNVIRDVKVENKLKGKGKRPKVSGLVSGEGSNSSPDHHMKDSLSVFFQKAQSSVTKKSHPSSSLREKTGSQDLEDDGLNHSSEDVGGNSIPVAVQSHTSVAKLTYEKPIFDGGLLSDAGLKVLDSVIDQYKIEERNRICQDSDCNRQNDDRSQGLYSIRNEMMRLEDRKHEPIVDPSGLNVQEEPCSLDKPNDGESQHTQNSENTQTSENRIRHCSVTNSSALTSCEQQGEILAVGNHDLKGGFPDALSIQSKDVLARCTSGADCDISSSTGNQILIPHYNDDLLNKSNFSPDELKGGETPRDCVVAYTEGKDLVSRPLHLENANTTDCQKSSIQFSNQAEILQTASVQKGSYCEDLSSDEASKEKIIPKHDYITSNEEVDGASPPLYTTLDENESFPEDTVFQPDIRNKDDKQVLLRAPRNVRKRRHGDMAYEGDVDWEINDQGLDSDNSNRARVKFDSSSSIGTEAESGGAAAVSAGLKAHTAGPVEKIKFKEILKRRGGLQDYLECRNQILALWSKDVSRILPLTDCGVTEPACVDEPGRASLIRNIYAFLDLSGYINVGIAAEKDKAEDGSKHDYKILREKPFEEVSGVSVADSEDGVSFIIGQVKNSNAFTDTENGITDNSENLTEGATKDNAHVGAVALELLDAKIPGECQTDYLENCNGDARFQSRSDNLDVSSSDPSGDILDGGVVPIVTPVIKKESQSIQSTPFDHLPSNNTLQCGPEDKKEIIVIGAGPAGLTAARHLQRQGFSVNILEARSRIGGRVYTDRSSLSVAVDLGASIITGVEADWATERRPDPSSLVCAQLGLELTVLNSDCPLYDIETGQKVPADLDEALEAEFNSLLDDMVLLVAQKGERAERMSLEEGFEYVLKRRRMAQSGSAEEIELHNPRDDARTNIDGSIAEKSCSKPEVLSPLERRVMDWHFANLEYGCAAPLKEVSLPNWNQDDAYGGFGGAHCMIKGGYSTVVESLGEGLRIHLDHVVTDISYGENSELNNSQCNKVKVSTSNGRIFSGDAVLITVPLGCLKAETIKFSPPLPQWKHSSIMQLGFGVLNKVVLEFPDVFWDDSVDYFGATAEDTDLRGQCFMFWNIKKTVGAPVLIALVVGKAAIEGQKMSSSDHVNHALVALRKLFGVASVPDPVASVVTDWGRDPFSYGAYSYVAVGASGKDYDILGRPVNNCLFFAGEATCKEHPDTVGGAMMSGLREAVRIIDILTTGYDYTAEAEAMESIQRQSASEKDEVWDITRRLDAVELSKVLYKNKESLLQELFFNAKSTKGRLHLVKELLTLPAETLKSFAGTKEGLTTLNSWILDSMGKAGTQLLRHCVRLLVLVSTDLLAVRLSGIGKTIREKVCVHTSRDIRAIASQLVSVWLEVFRREKASNGGLKLSKQASGVDSLKRKTVRDSSSGKPPLHMYHGAFEHKGQESASMGSHLPSNHNVKKVNGKTIKLERANSSRYGGSTGRPHDDDFAMTEEERAAIAAAEAARAAAIAAAKAYASSEAKSSSLLQLPKIPSFHKFARRDQYPQMDEYDFRRKWSGGVLGTEDCISEIDSRNCKVRNWSVDFSAACVNLDSSRKSIDNLSEQSHPNEVASQLNFREHSGESAAVDSSIYTKAWVDTAGSVGVKDYHAIEMWQSQAAAADLDFFHPDSYVKDEEDSNTTSKGLSWKHEGLLNESSVSQVTVNKGSSRSHRRGADQIKHAVVDYVASLLMPLYKAKKIDREGYKSIMKKGATKVMEQATDSEKAMAVSEFLDFKRRNKIRAFVDKLIEKHMAMKPVVKS